MQADRESKSVNHREAETLPDIPSAESLQDSSNLSANQLLADRFKIIRFLGKGGMGEVYAAEDLELGEQVALKTVRPEIASDRRIIARFRKEIQMARRVTHPNVCRTYDLFHHSAKNSSGRDRITFLTMELLRGETLAERLRRAGPMHASESLPIILQMTAALGAAHKAGIVHGDFKSSNVMLVPMRDGQAPRVVVTDFGLARRSETDETSTQSQRTGDIVGTPAYMAPEQLQGGPTTAAVDVYSFGIVVYELLTGKRPFEGASSFSVALERLQHDPPSPRTLVPDLDPNWEKTILRCLDREPLNRFASIAEVPAALAGESRIPAAALTGARPVSLKRSRRSRARLATGLALMLCAGIVAALLYRSGGVRPEGASSRRSVAVLGFTNLTGREEAAWLSTAFSEMLNTELAAGEHVRTIPGETVARMKVELALAETSGFAPDTMTRIRRYLDADFIVYGAYVMLGDVVDKIRLDMRLQDASNGEILATMTDEGRTSETLELVSRAGAQLREELGIPALSDTEIIGIRAAVPSSSEAARFYVQGLMRLQVFDAFGAREMLEKAVAADPKHALARSALATSWSMLGYPRRAKEEADAALSLSQSLPREERLLVEGRYQEAVLDWKGASQVYATLFSLFPDQLEYGLRLASAQVSAGKTQDAANTIKKLREFPATDNENPRIDVVQARWAGAVSDFQTQQALAAAAVTKGKALGARLLVAGARLLEGSAFVNLGDLEKARAAFEEARGMYVAAGDRWDAANAATNFALALAEWGDLDGAKASLESSLMTYRELGDQRGTAAALVNLGTVLRSQGKFTEARSAYEQALAIYRQTGDRSGEAKALNNLANLAAASGDLPEARKLFQEALAVLRDGDDANAMATVLVNLGELIADQGDLAAAERSYEKSLAIFRDVDNKNSMAHTMDRIAELRMMKGDLAGARTMGQEALALRKQIGETGSDTQLTLANLLLAEGSALEAERMARSAAAQFHEEGRPGDEASALTVLARALFAQGKLRELPQRLEQALQMSESGNRSVRLSVRIASASISAAIGRPAEAIPELNRVAAECQRAGLVGLELQARLALAEVEIRAGRRTQGLDRLRSVEDTARRRGYVSIANRAADARAREARAS